MELTVIGKYGPYPKAVTGSASCYLVKNKEDMLLMDMGSGSLSRLMGIVDIRKINHIFISHLHYDHTSDLLPFRYLLEDLGHKVNIYTHKEDTEWYKILFDHPNFDVINIDENTEIEIGSMTLSFLKMKHTSTDYAVLVKGEKTLCYTGDTLYNDNIPLCFEKSDIVLADCSKPEGFSGPHMNIKNAKELVKKYLKPIIATHLSVDYDPTEDLKDYELIKVAKELKTYIL